MDDDSIFIDETGERRIRKELVVPVCFGSVAFWLGKKASDFNSHRWVVYVRGPNNEDISHVFPKVTFGLHHTFKDPARLHEVQPYEVTEHGWGEFDIGIKLHLTPDARERDIEVYHKLKLYSEEDGSQQNTKKPVVSETYDQFVFTEPTEKLWNKVHAALANPQPAPPSPLLPYFPVVDDTEELTKIREGRMKVATQVMDLRRQYDVVM